ncbi:MAG: glycoside hydrolase family 18 protein [bacterium]
MKSCIQLGLFAANEGFSYQSPLKYHSTTRFAFLRRIVTIALLLVSGSLTAHSQIVAGYYAEWTTQEYPPSAIPLQNLTHVIHAFAWPNADGSISYPQGFLTPVPELTQRAHTAGKKVLLSLGGYTDSLGFSPMAGNSTARAKFVTTLTALCLTNHYDGADLDWEYPENTTDRQNLTLLVQDIRAYWKQAAPNLMLTMTINADDWRGKFFDVATLHPLLDWIGVMTYCYYGSWAGMSGHNAPLYSNPLDPLAAGSIDQSIRQYFHDQRGVPYNKLVSGIPFYGLAFTGTTQLYKPAAGGNACEYTVASTLNYTYNWDSVSQVPYLTSPLNGGTIVTFEDPVSVRLKCQYAKAQGLAGVMIWELSQDLLSIGNQPLLSAVGSEMLALPPPPPPPPAAPTNNFASGEIRSVGTISGSLSSLLTADNVYESIKEGLSSGTAKKRYSYLSHIWTFDVTGGTSVVFTIQAHHSTNQDGDHFAFSYSTDNVNFSSMLTVTKTTDDNAFQTFSLPATVKGKVYVRVMDTNRTAGKTSQDTLYVDQMFIRSTP